MFMHIQTTFAALLAEAKVHGMAPAMQAPNQLTAGNLESRYWTTEVV